MIGSVRVATYNIRHAAPAGRRADLARMQSAVTSLGADVVALQEVDRHVVRSCWADQAARLGRSAGLSAHFAPARALGPFGRYGNALLVRGEPSRVERWQLRSVGEPRVAILAAVALDGAAVTVVATHLQNRRAGRPHEAPEQLDEVLGVLATWPEPWILMGDLNLRPEVVEPRLDAAGLVAVPGSPTYPSDHPRLRLDWIAVRGLEVRSWEVPELQASDHRPLVADLARIDPRPGGPPDPLRHVGGS